MNNRNLGGGERGGVRGPRLGAPGMAQHRVPVIARVVYGKGGEGSRGRGGAGLGEGDQVTVFFYTRMLTNVDA